MTMTKKQKQRFLKVIMEDAATRNILLDEHGKMCIVGGLMHELGIAIEVGQRNPSVKQQDFICEEFGISVTEMRELIRINDDQEIRKYRQQALRRYVREVL